MRLQGKVALITGAATGERDDLKGIGGATAWLFVREGAKVVLADIDDAPGERSASQIRESGGDAVYLHLDVCEEADWANAIKATVDKYGRLDILVNNAGGSVGGSRGMLEDISVEAWDGTVRLNAGGCFLGTKHAIPEMRKAGGGSIVNVGSIDGVIGETVPLPPYQAGKGAMRIFTRAAAIQYARENIRVNTVHPGYTTTPAYRKSTFSPEVREHLLSKVPLGRRGTALDIAYGILYLASDEASYVTGAELIIDGGVTAQ